jgi:hypothetical protein
VAVMGAIVASLLYLELTRFRGHLILWKGRESRNAEDPTAVPG